MSTSPPPARWHASPGNELEETALRTARFVANIMTPGLAERVDASNVIDDLIAREDLTMVLQPVFDLETGAMRGLESLARFPGSGQAPDWWFALAHRVGRGADLELLAVREALALLPRIPDPIRLSINVGPDGVLDPRFPGLFDEVDTHRLTVELTEHTAIHDYPAVLAAIGRLRARGIALSVDDAGSGYSGLSHIRQMLPDVIKLDRDLVTGIDTDAVRQALGMAIAAFAERIGAIVIAEGIEHAAEADMVREIGVGYGQGYFLGRPAPVEHWFPTA